MPTYVGTNQPSDSLFVTCHNYFPLLNVVNNVGEVYDTLEFNVCPIEDLIKPPTLPVNWNTYWNQFTHYTVYASSICVDSLPAIPDDPEDRPADYIVLVYPTKGNDQEQTIEQLMAHNDCIYGHVLANATQPTRLEHYMKSSQVIGMTYGMDVSQTTVEMNHDFYDGIPFGFPDDPFRWLWTVLVHFPTGTQAMTTHHTAKVTYYVKFFNRKTLVAEDIVPPFNQ